MTTSYCPSPYLPLRRPTREVRIGGLTIGGSRPIAVQSMTVTETLDVEATAAQAIELARAGSELVRITAPTVKAAAALAAGAAQGFEQERLASVNDVVILPGGAQDSEIEAEVLRR